MRFGTIFPIDWKVFAGVVSCEIFVWEVALRKTITVIKVSGDRFGSAKRLKNWDCSQNKEKTGA
jgi:hypothetical protein